MRRPAIAYEVVWVVAPLIAFSLFPTKRINYLLPLVPAVAILAGRWWASATTRVEAPVLVRTMGASTVAVGVALLVASYRAVLPEALLSVGVVVGPLWIGSGTMTWLAAQRQRWGVAFGSAAAALTALYLIGYAALEDPEVEGFFKISRPPRGRRREVSIGRRAGRGVR